MKNNVVDINLPDIKSFEEFESFKLHKTDIVENALYNIIQKHRLPAGILNALEGTNIVYALGNESVIKIYPPIHKEHYLSESLVLKNLQGKLSIKTPILEYEGEISGWPYVVISRIKGSSLEGLWENLEYSNKIIIIRELATLIREVHSLPTEGLEVIDCHWPEFIKKQINHCQVQHQNTHLSECLIQQMFAYLEPIKEDLLTIEKPVILTGEYTPMNLIVQQKGSVWHIEGLIDFGDSMLGLPEYDLLGPGCFLIQGDKSLLREFLKAYGFSLDSFSADRLDELSHKLTALMLLHRYSNLEVQIRIKDWKSKVKNLKDLENLVWGL